jgi:DNA mismatch repair protein MutS
MPQNAPTRAAPGATPPATADSARPRPRLERSGPRTPMMDQWWAAKEEQPDALLFFRMGDFYELFGDDAAVAARELGITLTRRDKSEGGLPMAGVPVRSVEGYLLRLVRKGFRVAICEQLTDPKQTKGLVERGIVRVVTAGTLTEEEALDARAANYLCTVHLGPTRAGLAWVDLSTGRLQVADVEPQEVLDLLARVAPAEVLLASDATDRQPELAAELYRTLGPRLAEREAWRFEARAMAKVAQRHFKVQTLAGFGLEDHSAAVPAVGALLEYLTETQKSACEHVRRIEPAQPSRHLLLDRATRTCLELVATQREGRREGSLLEVLDRTCTPMGGRALREWVLGPLREVEAIVHRQRAVAEWVEEPFRREQLRELLAQVRDLERLAGKIATGRANGRDLVALAGSTAQMPALKSLLGERRAARLGELATAVDELADLTARVQHTLVDVPPQTVREGGLIRSGFHAELDELRTIAGDGKSWMARFQAEEQARSGLPGLKIGFNSVFGYYLEVPRGQVERVPAHYIRKQTVKTAERYITPELKQFETKVLEAEERSKALEYQLFEELRSELATQVGRILDTAAAVAEVDALASLAQVAADHRYVAPELHEGLELTIEGGRHPVIELSPSCESFVPNDTRLDGEGRLLTLLTGPNMAGKSTYIRQTALIVLLAQIGSFVPASAARIGVSDRIFTRVGAGDDISRGESTFMVEMVEIANILNNAGPRSLVVLDEVGRGTSTFDGLALAWAIVEHLQSQVRARTLFATHYHQLTELAQRLPGVTNASVAVREWGDEIVFLHQIVEGGTDRSYGIHVARLAGVPEEVVQRARQVLAEIEDDSAHLAPRIAGASHPRPGGPQQLELFAPESAVERELRGLDPDRLTPIDALLELRRLRGLLGGA